MSNLTTTTITHERTEWSNGSGPAITADQLNRIEAALEFLLGNKNYSCSFLTSAYTCKLHETDDTIKNLLDGTTEVLIECKL